MQQLLDDRRVLVPVLLTAIAIAIGAVAIVLLSDDATGGASASSASSAQPQSAATGAVTVDIADFKFKPVDVTVKAGAKVTWVNRDSAEHTATAAGGFDTGAIVKGAKKTETFAKPGTYAYICAFHPFMKGTVVVR
jgi:plastocyanin